MSDDVALPVFLEEPVELAYEIHSASGWPELFSAVGHRYDAKAGFAPPENMESWVVLYDRGQITLTCPGTDWYTRTWMSPSGVVYVTDAAGVVHVNRNVRAHAHDWETIELGPVMMGVWGLHDDLVFAWGKLGRDSPIFLWDGKTWSEIPNLGALVLSMHGLTPDAIYAVCDQAVVARWDGHSWQQFPVPTMERLAGVHVVSPDEMYATGNAGTLLEGSAHGWGKVTGWTSSLYGVCFFAGELWIAGGESGLLRRATRNGNVLLELEPEIIARTFDARGEWMLISCDEEVCATDGVQFQRGMLKDALPNLLSATQPLWLPPRRPRMRG